MIFVTVGTERYPFNRLVHAIDESLSVISDEPLFAQTGTCTYLPHCPSEPFISPEKFAENIRNARIVVSHAGAGTLMMCVEYGKIPIMMPRNGRLGEHVDNHQHMLAEKFALSGRILSVNNARELQHALANYDSLCELLPSHSEKNHSLTKNLYEFIQNIQKIK